MTSTTPKLIVILLGVLAFFIFMKIINADQKYSTEEYWESATIDDTYDIPSEVLMPGNNNGPVLMWAASVSNSPEVISALIDQGADVNESDSIFQGTALSAAAYQNQNPDIIDTLVNSGANVNIVLGRLKKSPLLLAAEENNVAVTERLLAHGADAAYQDRNGKTAQMIAEQFGNKAVAEYYRQLLATQ